MLEYRQGLETDLDNVLQIPNVFFNVPKGQICSKDELEQAFGKKSLDDIILEILKKGELQVGEKERNAQLDRIHKEVLDIVSGKLIDPDSKRVYTTGMIDKALDELSAQSSQAKEEETKSDEAAGAEGDTEPAAKAKPKPKWTGVVATKSAKSQALEAMKALIAWQPIPVMRARMKLRITCQMSILKQPAKLAPKAQKDDGEGEKAKGTIKDRILSYVEEVINQGTSGDNWEVTGFVEPGAFKGLSEFIAADTKGKGRVEVLETTVVREEV